jgi:hypothetical protein
VLTMKDLLLGDYGVYSHDLLIDPATLDLKWATDVDYIVQKITIRLLLFRQEWYLDQTLGLPWLTDILTKNPNMAYVDALIKTAIAGTPGVQGMISYSSELDGSTRTMSVTFEAKLDTGEVTGPVTVTVP